MLRGARSRSTVWQRVQRCPDSAWCTLWQLVQLMRCGPPASGAPDRPRRSISSHTASWSSAASAAAVASMQAPIA